MHYKNHNIHTLLVKVLHERPSRKKRKWLTIVRVFQGLAFMGSNSGPKYVRTCSTYMTGSSNDALFSPATFQFNSKDLGVFSSVIWGGWTCSGRSIKKESGRKWIAKYLKNFLTVYLRMWEWTSPFPKTGITQTPAQHFLSTGQSESSVQRVEDATSGRFIQWSLLSVGLIVSVVEGQSPKWFFSAVSNFWQPVWQTQPSFSSPDYNSDMLCFYLTQGLRAFSKGELLVLKKTVNWYFR